MATHIHVVLTDDLPNDANTGELACVPPGSARNYRIPRGLAISATAENVARIEHAKKVVESKNAKLRGEAQELAAKLQAAKVTITKPVGEGDRLYGSVTSRDVEEALAQQGFTVDRRRIEMEPIKQLGTTLVTVRLATGISAAVEVTVTAKT